MTGNDKKILPLTVGQYVYMFSGCYMCVGEVVKIMPLDVDVLTREGRLLGFDRDGTGHSSTYECGPWYIDDMPFAERTALFEEAERKFLKWQSMDCEHGASGTHYYIEKCPICGCDNPNYNPTAAKKRLEGKGE
jgi:hypothetical protein